MSTPVSSSGSASGTGAIVSENINGNFMWIFVVLQKLLNSTDDLLLDVSKGMQKASDAQAQISNAFETLENANTNPVGNPAYASQEALFGGLPIQNSIWEIQNGGDAQKYGPQYTDENTREQTLIKSKDGEQQIWSSSLNQINQNKQSPISIGSALAQYAAAFSRLIG